DPTARETTLEAGFFPEMLHIAGQFGLTKAMGIPAPILSSQLDTFRSYLRIPNPIVSGINALLRGGYPTEFSTPSDSPSYGDDPFVGADYLYPETSDAGYWKKNWQWMGRHNTSPQEFPVGYFLRSWARSEAAALQVCTNSNAQN
ncbi:MAG: hypothetical protein ACREDR_34375, partial [Blastocatellia bacterium]